MCTVTFVPSKATLLITANRDEKSGRKQAIAPAVYQHGDTSIIYPKDADAGGTWIAMKANGDAAVLLNGAFENHIPSPAYSKSRGVVFLEIFADALPVKKFADIPLPGIEPFTLILFCNGKLYENRWDGTGKFSKQLNKSIPHIWSSATLYDAATVQKRAQWFAEWQIKNPYPDQQDVLSFHLLAGDGNSANDLHMNRDGMLLTVSVTGISLSYNKAVMQYLDLKDKSIHEKEILLNTKLQTLS